MNTIELTEKQKAIEGQLFKDNTSNTFFTVNVYKVYFTNDGQKAYYLTGKKKQSVYTEDVLMTAIYKGRCKKGFTDITAYKKRTE